MDFYTTISTVVCNNSQFLLLLVVTYCVLKIVHLEKHVKYLQYDLICLKGQILHEGDEDKTETDEDEGDENDEDDKDEDYDPEEESSDTSEDEGPTI